MANVSIEGLGELSVKLRQLQGALADEKVEKILMEQGGEPLREQVAWNAPRLTGQTAKSIVAKPGRKINNAPSVLVAVDFKQIKKPGAEESRYPYVVEYGAPAHEIKPKAPHKALKLFGRVFVESVMHPGSKGKFFFRSALNMMKPKIKDNIERELKRVVDNVASGSYGGGSVQWGAGSSSILGEGE